MKTKKWQVTVAAIMAMLVMVISPLGAFAATNDQASAGARLQWEGGLAIVAPRAAPINQEVSLGIFLRQNQEPVAGASVWAATKDAAESLKNEMQTLKEKGANLTESDYEAVLNNKAFRIGTSGTDGRLVYTFKEAGQFVMIAFKAHFFPDIAGIVVGEKQGARSALDIHAPKQANVGESIIISVFESSTADKIKDAAVWSLTKAQADALKAKIAGAKESKDLKTVNWESELKSLSAVFLGMTNGSGDLKYAFSEAGGRLLVALKPGFLPGRAAIVIGQQQTNVKSN